MAGFESFDLKISLHKFLNSYLAYSNWSEWHNASNLCSIPSINNCDQYMKGNVSVKVRGCLADGHLIEPVTGGSVNITKCSNHGTTVFDILSKHGYQM